ncbi:MAG: folylpolyglutamate synthase/dihydrofolate synthase family protein [Tissierellia bacterium]|nr:folylpolyglutamate synthase/dihydrofolate synthase family protein [Tissierellia bacterium]
MDYAQAMEYIDREDKRGHRGGLQSIEKLLNALGHPEDALRFIHITGTNGKGSTAAFTSSMLQEGGYQVGLFTSPHILSFQERFRINGLPMPEEAVANYMEQVKAAVERVPELVQRPPSYFEITVAIGMLYFRDMAVDYVVLEVGIGGANDPTNIVKNTELCIFTPISYDHVDRLGRDLEGIAEEKAGIIKPGCAVAVYPSDPIVCQRIAVHAQRAGVELAEFDPDAIKISYSGEEGSEFVYNGSSYRITLVGVHQVYNAALALFALEVLGMDLPYEVAARGLIKTTWVGRMTRLMRHPSFFIDGAHNEHGIQALLQTLSLFRYERLILGIGTMKDKDILPGFQELIKMADQVIVTSIDYERAYKEEDLLKSLGLFDAIPVTGVGRAVDRALELAGPKDLILFTGSLYLVGEVFAYAVENGLID